MRSKVLATFLTYFLFYSCAGTLPLPLDLEKEKRAARLLERAYQFYGHLNKEEFEAIWEMGAIRRAIDRLEYTDNLRKMFSDSEIVVQSLRVQDLDEPIAITRGNIYYAIRDQRSYFVCEKMLWKYQDGDWYFYTTGLMCDFELSKQERELYKK